MIDLWVSLMPDLKLALDLNGGTGRQIQIISI